MCLYDRNKGYKFSPFTETIKLSKILDTFPIKEYRDLSYDEIAEKNLADPLIFQSLFINVLESFTSIQGSTHRGCKDVTDVIKCFMIGNLLKIKTVIFLDYQYKSMKVVGGIEFDSSTSNIVVGLLGGFICALNRSTRTDNLLSLSSVFTITKKNISRNLVHCVGINIEEKNVWVDNWCHAFSQIENIKNTEFILDTKSRSKFLWEQNKINSQSWEDYIRYNNYKKDIDKYCKSIPPRKSFQFTTVQKFEDIVLVPSIQGFIKESPLQMVELEKVSKSKLIRHRFEQIHLEIEQNIAERISLTQYSYRDIYIDERILEEIVYKNNFSKVKISGENFMCGFLTIQYMLLLDNIFYKVSDMFKITMTTNLSEEHIVAIYYICGGTRNLIFIEGYTNKEKTRFMSRNINYYIHSLRSKFCIISNEAYHWEPLELGGNLVINRVEEMFQTIVKESVLTTYEYIDLNLVQKFIGNHRLDVIRDFILDNLEMNEINMYNLLLGNFDESLILAIIETKSNTLKNLEYNLNRNYIMNKFIETENKQVFYLDKIKKISKKVLDNYDNYTELQKRIKYNIWKENMLIDRMEASIKDIEFIKIYTNMSQLLLNQAPNYKYSLWKNMFSGHPKGKNFLFFKSINMSQNQQMFEQELFSKLNIYYTPLSMKPANTYVIKRLLPVSTGSEHQIRDYSFVKYNIKEFVTNVRSHNLVFRSNLVYTQIYYENVYSKKFMLRICKLLMHYYYKFNEGEKLCHSSTMKLSNDFSEFYSNKHSCVQANILIFCYNNTNITIKPNIFIKESILLNASRTRALEQKQQLPMIKQDTKTLLEIVKQEEKIIFKEKVEQELREQKQAKLKEREKMQKEKQMEKEGITQAEKESVNLEYVEHSSKNVTKQIIMEGNETIQDTPDQIAKSRDFLQSESFVHPLVIEGINMELIKRFERIEFRVLHSAINDEELFEEVALMDELQMERIKKAMKSSGKPFFASTMRMSGVKSSFKELQHTSIFVSDRFIKLCNERDSDKKKNLMAELANAVMSPMYMEFLSHTKGLDNIEIIVSDNIDNPKSVINFVDTQIKDQLQIIKLEDINVNFDIPTNRELVIADIDIPSIDESVVNVEGIAQTIDSFKNLVIDLNQISHEILEYSKKIQELKEVQLKEKTYADILMSNFKYLYIVPKKIPVEKSFSKSLIYKLGIEDPVWDKCFTSFGKFNELVNKLSYKYDVKFLGKYSRDYVTIIKQLLPEMNSKMYVTDDDYGEMNEPNQLKNFMTMFTLRHDLLGRNFLRMFNLEEKKLDMPLSVIHETLTRTPDYVMLSKNKRNLLFIEFTYSKKENKGFISKGYSMSTSKYYPEMYTIAKLYSEELDNVFYIPVIFSENWNTSFKSKLDTYIKIMETLRQDYDFDIMYEKEFSLGMFEIFRSFEELSPLIYPGGKIFNVLISRGNESSGGFMRKASVVEYNPEIVDDFLVPRNKDGTFEKARKFYHYIFGKYHTNIKDIEVKEGALELFDDTKYSESLMYEFDEFSDMYVCFLSSFFNNIDWTMIAEERHSIRDYFETIYENFVEISNKQKVAIDFNYYSTLNNVLSEIYHAPLPKFFVEMLDLRDLMIQTNILSQYRVPKFDIINYGIKESIKLPGIIFKDITLTLVSEYSDMSVKENLYNKYNEISYMISKTETATQQLKNQIIERIENSRFINCRKFKQNSVEELFQMYRVYKNKLFNIIAKYIVQIDFDQRDRVFRDKPKTLEFLSLFSEYEKYSLIPKDFRHAFGLPGKVKPKRKALWSELESLPVLGIDEIEPEVPNLFIERTEREYKLSSLKITPEDQYIFSTHIAFLQLVCSNIPRIYITRCSYKKFTEFVKCIDINTSSLRRILVRKFANGTIVFYNDDEYSEYSSIEKIFDLSSMIVYSSENEFFELGLFSSKLVKIMELDIDYKTIEELVDEITDEDIDVIKSIDQTLARFTGELMFVGDKDIPSLPMACMETHNNLHITLEEIDMDLSIKNIEMFIPSITEYDNNFCVPRVDDKEFSSVVTYVEEYYEKYHPDMERINVQDTLLKVEKEQDYSKMKEMLNPYKRGEFFDISSAATSEINFLLDTYRTKLNEDIVSCSNNISIGNEVQKNRDRIKYLEELVHQVDLYRRAFKKKY
jgi:hypothetical protein